MKVLVGDIFESGAHTLVNTVNCVGVMGKGIAKEFKDRYPDMFRDYKARCARGDVRPGEPYVFEDLFGASVINFPTKDHWRSSSRLEYIEKGLDWICDNWQSLGTESIAVPPLGCGNGGLRWEDVGPLTYKKLVGLPCEVVMYAPFGTPAYQLEPSFLEGRGKTSGAGVRGSYRLIWDAVVCAIGRINADPFALTVGHVAYQKICYALARCGVDLGFTFVKGSYGPFSSDAKRALVEMGSSNRIVEKRRGDKLEVFVNPSFALDELRFGEDVEHAIDRVVDLFCRFRNAEQAEIAATLMFAFDAVCASRDDGQACEDEVVRYAFDWKPRWAESNGMRGRLNRDLYYLCALGWVDVAGLTYDGDE